MSAGFGRANLVRTIPQARLIGFGAALITVVSYLVLLIVIAVAAAASGLFVSPAGDSGRSTSGTTPRTHPTSTSTSRAAIADNRGGGLHRPTQTLDSFAALTTWGGWGS